jgi:antitoxin PrlF
VTAAAVSAFLDFLARDIALHPERLRPLDPAFVARIRALVEGVEVDLDAPLPPDV